MAITNLYNELNGAVPGGFWTILSGPLVNVTEVTTSTSFPWIVGTIIPNGDTPTVDFTGTPVGIYTVCVL